MNPRPIGYEPIELPGCSTPHYWNTGKDSLLQLFHWYGIPVVYCMKVLFCDVLSQVRKQKQLSQSGLVKLMAKHGYTITVTSVRNWEADRRTPDICKQQLLIKTLQEYNP